MLDFSDITDFFRNGTNNGVIFILLFVVCGPALADSNFVIQRMVQYDISSVPYGSRASALNMEAKSLGNYLARNCILTRFQDLTIEKFRDATGRGGAGGFIILLPKNLTMGSEEKESIFVLEQALMTEEVPVPVYFSKYDENINQIINEISLITENSKRKESALLAMFNKISANLYNVVVTGASHSPKKESKIPVIQGELIPFKHSTKPEEVQQNKLPVIIVTTQLKAFGITHLQPSNFDATILLTLINAFSKLYNQMSSSAKYRIVFVLHESGPLLNFQGVKKFLEANSEETLTQNAEFAICLDTLADQPDLTMHISKPLKEGPVNKFFEILKEKSDLYGNKSLTHVHKKINLAETFHKWAHERFSMKRINAFTLSSLQSYSDPLRTSIFSEHVLSSSTLESGEDQLDDFILTSLRTNAKILAEALATYIFLRDDNESGEIFTGPMAITADSIKPFIATKSMSKSHNVKMTFEKYLKNVKMYDEKADARDPEFLFYDGEEAVLNIYNVKPAIFDLLLTSIIVCYLLGVYFLIIQFPKFYHVINKFSTYSNQANGSVVSKTK